MVVFDFFASAALGVVFSAAPKFWRNCTDENMKSFVNRLFLVLALSQVLKLFICAVVMVAGFLR